MKTIFASKMAARFDGLYALSERSVRALGIVPARSFAWPKDGFEHPAFMLFVLALSLCPLISVYWHDGYQSGHDGPVTLFRVYSLQAAYQDGQFPARWFPDFDGGYGSPYPSFYGMLFYYVALALTFLKLSIGASLELTAFLTFVAAAFAMFFFVRSLWGASAGFLAAILYSYAPYHLVDGFVRGAYSELATFVWFPLILHSGYGWLRTERRRYLCFGALCISGLILTHNIMPIVFLPVALIFPLLEPELLGRSRAVIKKRLLGLIWCWSLAVLLSAFFWLPIAVKHGNIRIEYFFQFDYHTGFASLQELFSLANEHTLSKSVGLIHFEAAIVAVLLCFLLRVKIQYKSTLIGAFAVVCFYIFLMTDLSHSIWEHISLLRFVQFPWRLLAPMTFFLSIAAGGLPLFIRHKTVRLAVISALAIGAICLHAPMIQITRRSDMEILGARQVRSTAFGTQDYRPRWTTEPFWPIDGSAPRNPIAMMLPMNYADAVRGASDTLEIVDVRRQGTKWSIAYRASKDGVIVIPQFYYPGWVAWLDGEPETITPSDRDGFLQIKARAGNHQLSVAFAQTFADKIGNILSLIGIGLLGFTVFPYRQLRSFQRKRKGSDLILIEEESCESQDTPRSS